ncbi:MAG: hypothetical protein NC204_00110 [Candidatus Amulumruptor caecigallinarius]|nr:hypothetical protein [Candidatus Amulumruptor caecigallinarius]
MKKIYAIALLAGAALSANAQNGAPLYLTGDSNSFGATWAPSSPAEMLYNNGVYTFLAEGCGAIKVSTAKSAVEGQWDEFNAGALCVDGGPAAYGTEQGVVVPLVQGDANINTPWFGDWTIEIAGDLSTIKLTTTTPKPNDTSLKLYFRGDINNWGNDGVESLANYTWEAYEGSETIFKYTAPITIPAGQGWKISTAPNWNDLYNYGDGGLIMLEVETELACGGGTSGQPFEEDFNGVGYLNIVEPAGNVPAIIWFSNDKDAECPFEVGGVEGITVENANAPVEIYNLQGVRVNEATNGIFIVKQGDKVTKIVK